MGPLLPIIIAGGAYLLSSCGNKETDEQKQLIANFKKEQPGELEDLSHKDIQRKVGGILREVFGGLKGQDGKDINIDKYSYDLIGGINDNPWPFHTDAWEKLSCMLYFDSKYAPALKAMNNNERKPSNSCNSLFCGVIYNNIGQPDRHLTIDAREPNIAKLKELAPQGEKAIQKLAAMLAQNSIPQQYKAEAQRIVDLYNQSYRDYGSALRLCAPDKLACLEPPPPPPPPKCDTQLTTCTQSRSNLNSAIAKAKDKKCDVASAEKLAKETDCAAKTCDEILAKAKLFDVEAAKLKDCKPREINPVISKTSYIDTQKQVHVLGRNFGTKTGELTINGQVIPANAWLDKNIVGAADLKPATYEVAVKTAEGKIVKSSLTVAPPPPTPKSPCEEAVAQGDIKPNKLGKCKSACEKPDEGVVDGKITNETAFQKCIAIQ
ncbi:MAG: hypothetical protein NT030_07630 [Candidatus Saganbacteria bacterium]|nr:hypothetical protein [Candidatus Saganbacteria bacterium]